MTPEQIRATIGLPKTLIKPLEKIAEKIDLISIETGFGDGYWIYPLQGYTFEQGGAHAAHERTIKELIKVVKDGPMICKCNDCEN